MLPQVRRIAEMKRKGLVLCEDQPCLFNFSSQRRDQTFRDMFLQLTSPISPAPRRINVSGPRTD